MKPYRIHLVVIALYTLLTVGLTWPLTAHLATHVPGEATWAFDESTFIWNMGWFKYSLLDLGQTPLHTNYIFFPLGIHLTTYTFNLFNAAFGLPLQLALSLPLASNLTLIFSYISSGYGMFLLSLYLLVGQASCLSSANRQDACPTVYYAAFIAGAVFAFSASRMMYVALGHYNFVTIQWFPFYVLFLLKAQATGRQAHIFLASLMAAFCIYTELTYAVFLLFLTILIFLNRRTGILPVMYGQARCLSYLFIYTALLIAPFIMAVLPDFLNPTYAEPGWGEGLKLSADLAGLITLTPLHPLAGVDWLNELRAVIAGTSRFSDANTLFLGYGILLMAACGAVVAWPLSRVWRWSALTFTILSLGPLLTINGQNRFNLDGLEVTFPLPFALLHYLPLINANRVPNRFGIPLTMTLAILVGYGLAWLFNKKSRLTPYFLLLTPFLLLFDQYSVPLPLTSARIPLVYHHIGAETGDFTIMQLPLGWRNSYGTLGAEQTQLQYYQTVHHRPMLGGNTSRNPAFKFDYYRRIPLFFALTETELYRPVDETMLARARQQAAELMTLYNIKYLVIHDPIPQRKPYEDTFTATQTLALTLIPHQAEPIYTSPVGQTSVCPDMRQTEVCPTIRVRAFAVSPAPLPNPLTIDFGEWTSAPYRGEGWDKEEQIYGATANWAIADQAEIFFPAHEQNNRTLQLHLAPFSYPNAPPQQMSLSLNEAGQPLRTVILNEGWQVITATLPQADVKNGLNRLRLNFAHMAQPRQVLPASQAIGQTGVIAPMDIEVNSGADFAFMTVGFGKTAQDASVHRRGVNVAVIDQKSGEIVTKRGFDTGANRYETGALNQFLASLPAGQIVIMATQGLEVTTFFDAETWAGLASLGLKTDLLKPPFSAIGVKDTPAPALQATGQGTAYLRLGANPDLRHLAAAVDWVKISH